MATRTADTEKQGVYTPRVKVLLVILGIVVLLAAAYCVLCLVAGRGDTFRANIAVNGYELGGLTQEEAREQLHSSLDGVTQVNGQECALIQLDPEVEGVEPYTVDLSAALSYDIEGCVEQAWQDDHGGMFLTRGFRYLSTLIRGRDYTIYPRATDADQVKQALEACGVLDMNTTVQTSYTLTEETIDFTMGTSGVSVDEQALAQQIIERTAAGNFEAISCPLVESDPDPVDVQAVHDTVYAEPANATLDVAEDYSYTVVPSVQGIDFDVSQAEQMISSAQQGETVSVPLNRQDPSIDTATLEAGLFRDVLGEYTTKVSGTSARRSNVQLSGEKCNGVILLPGEVFDYNAVVGERTAEAGFQAATAYSNGESVLELGGGVCQTSSTLYCAALYANLEIVERTNHSYVSSYVPIGMDATVSWGGPEFKFKNNTDYPIKIVATYENNRQTFQILGTKVSDFTVEITTSTLSVISPTVREVPDATLAAGTTVVEDNGHTGYKVQSYRHVYDGNGNLISEGKEAYSSYRMTEKVVRVGTMVAPAPEEPAPETPAAEQPAAETPAAGTPAA